MRLVHHHDDLILSTATLCQTIGRIANVVEPVVRAMATELWGAPCAQFDLTPVRCLDREHKGGSFMGQRRPWADIDSQEAARGVSRQANQMWVCAEPGGDVLYTWDRSKAAIVAEGIIPADYKGILQSEGGSDLPCFLKGGKRRFKPPPGIKRAACWAHVRRKFFEAAKAGCPIADRLLKIINVLYRIESQARDKGLSPDERALLARKRRAA